MKPSVIYNDKIGHASADISGIKYDQLAQKCNLGEKYTIIGISLYGTDDISVSLLCRDNDESTDQKEVLVNVYPNVELTIGEVLERLHVTINITNNSKYDNPDLDTDREVSIEEDKNDEEN